MSSIRFEVPGPPVAWHRPEPSYRVGERRKHPLDEEFQKRVAWIAMKARGARPVDKSVEWVLGTLGFYVPDLRRRDVDNLEKNVLDALVGVIYADDAQVVHVLDKFKRLDRENPRTLVELHETTGYLR